MKRTLHATKLALALLAGALSGCADEVPSTTQPCPCADGYVCCESGVCAAGESACGAATRALSEAAAGEWTGYIESFGLSQDDAIKLSISVDSDGALTGQVVFGKDAPPPPPTDPSKPWPENSAIVQVPENSPITAVPSYVAGFVYTAENVRWEAQRLRLQIGRYTPWEPWCALQTSYERPFGGYTCTPLEAVSRIDDTSCYGASYGEITCTHELQCFSRASCSGEECRGQCRGGVCCWGADCDVPRPVIDCAVASMCSGKYGYTCNNGICHANGVGVCDCNASGCMAFTEALGKPLVHTLDIALDGDEGQGSVGFEVDDSQRQNYNVRLIRKTR